MVHMQHLTTNRSCYHKLKQGSPNPNEVLIAKPKLNLFISYPPLMIDALILNHY